MATQKAVAEHLGLTDRSVRSYIERGTFPRPDGRGQLDLDACRLAYIEHLRERAAGRASDAAEAEGLDLQAERARLAKEQADGQAMKNALARGDLVSATAVTAALEQFIAVVKSGLRGVPAKVTRTDVEQQRRIARAIEDTLADLSATRVIEEMGGDGDDDDGDDDADD